MPAAAVIPAPIAYIGVAAVKKLVVGSRRRHGRARYAAGPTGDFSAVPNQRAGREGLRGPFSFFFLGRKPAAFSVYLEKIRVLKAG